MHATRVKGIEGPNGKHDDRVRQLPNVRRFAYLQAIIYSIVVLRWKVRDIGLIRFPC